VFCFGSERQLSRDVFASEYTVINLVVELDLSKLSQDLNMYVNELLADLQRLICVCLNGLF